jgi:hypothetical protein
VQEQRFGSDDDISDDDGGGGTLPPGRRAAGTRAGGGAAPVAAFPTGPFEVRAVGATARTGLVPCHLPALLFLYFFLKKLHVPHYGHVSTRTEPSGLETATFLRARVARRSAKTTGR